jgi:hypothetical protein
MPPRRIGIRDRAEILILDKIVMPKPWKLILTDAPEQTIKT